MCCAGISFANLNIKVLGPRIDGSIVDDLTDLIDGDSDGKCREENGNFMPCPPKELVQQVRNLRQRVARFTDTDGLLLAGQVEVQVNRLRRGNFIQARGGLEAIEDVLRDREGKPPRPQKPAAPQKPSKQKYKPVKKFTEQDFDKLSDEYGDIVDRMADLFGRDFDVDFGMGGQLEQIRELRQQLGRPFVPEYTGEIRPNAAIDDPALVEKFNEFAQQVAKLRSDFEQYQKQANVSDADIKAFIEEQRAKRAARAKKIRDSVKRFVSPAIRNYFERNNVRNMDEWLTGTEEEKEEKLLKWASRIFDVTFPDKNGNTYSTQLTGLSAHDDYISIEGYIIDADGDFVGSFSRVLSVGDDEEPFVYHDIFKLAEGYQKEGIGSSFIAATELAYVAAGFDYIKVSGVSSRGWNGATQWPKNGFDWYSLADKEDFLSHIRSAVNSDSVDFGSEERRDLIRALLKKAQQEGLGDPDRVTAADLLEFPGAEKHFQERSANVDYKRKLRG